MTVWTGAPDPSWLSFASIPLCVSHSRLRRRSREGLPHRSDDSPPWILDSGAYTFVTSTGGFPDTAAEYAARVRLYDSVTGGLAWASIQDYMTEDEALAATGLDVEAHQRLTVRSFLDLTAAWDVRPVRRPSPFVPVVQGRTTADVVRCARMYGDAGVDLAAAPVVGLGSVCRRESTREIADVVAALRAEVPGIRLHGFGVKTGGLSLYGADLVSVDSMAWSFAARKRRTKSPRCDQFHQVCSSCPTAAEDWHRKVSVQFAATRTAPAPEAGRASLRLVATAPAGATPVPAPTAAAAPFTRPALRLVTPADVDQAADVASGQLSLFA